MVVLWPSNAYVQATPGVGSLDFCTVDFGGAFFNWFYCVPCVLPDTLVLRSTKFIFCVRAALLAKRAFVACFTSWFSEKYIMSTRVSTKLRSVSNTLVQATLGVGTVNFWSFTAAWTGGIPFPSSQLNICTSSCFKLISRNAGQAEGVPCFAARGASSNR